MCTCHIHQELDACVCFSCVARFPRLVDSKCCCPRHSGGSLCNRLKQMRRARALPGCDDDKLGCMRVEQMFRQWCCKPCGGGTDESHQSRVDGRGEMRKARSRSPRGLPGLPVTSRGARPRWRVSNLSLFLRNFCNETLCCYSQPMCISCTRGACQGLPSQAGSSPCPTHGRHRGVRPQLLSPLH